MDAPLTLQTLLAPAELKCPLSNRLFVDPVIAADGYTYERSAILKHLEMSLKSPTSGKLLLHTNLTPHVRKQASSAEWLERMSVTAFNRALASAGAADASQIWDSFSVLAELKDLVGLAAFEANADWSLLAIRVAEHILSGLTGLNPAVSEDQTSIAEPRLAPLQLLYAVYEIRFSREDTAETRDNFARIRAELALCLFTLSETGFLEALLRAHREFNNDHLWRILVNVQVSFGSKKEAAKSCVRMAQFADANGLPELASSAREEALGLDPNVKMDGTDFQTMTFMTKEELRLATREEIVGSFLRDPLHQDNYEHLVDFLEDEGAILNAVRVVVAHTLTKNVPAQYQAATAHPLRRLVTLVAHLQAKFIPQLQILSTEANNHRAQLGQEKLNPPDLQSLLLQAHREEEYRTITVNLLETIAKKIAPPQAGTQPVPIMSQQAQFGSSPSSTSPSSPNSLNSPISALSHAQRQAQLRSSWGIKPAVGKDLRNKRFTMGLKTSGPSHVNPSPATGFFGSRANVDAAAELNSTSPLMGRATDFRGPAGGPRPSLAVENPIFSQPLDFPSRLHTPSVLTPFDADAFQQQYGMAPPFIPGQQTGPFDPIMPKQHEILAADDSPFSSTVFHTLPEQLGASGDHSPQMQHGHGTANPAYQAPQAQPTTVPSGVLSAADLDDSFAQVLALSEDLSRDMALHSDAGHEDDMPPPPPEDMDAPESAPQHYGLQQPQQHAVFPSSNSGSLLPQAQSLLPPQQSLPPPQQPLQPFGAPSTMTSVFAVPQPSEHQHSNILAPAAHLSIHSVPTNRSPSPLTGMTLSGLLPPTSMALGGYGGILQPAPTSTSTLSNPAILGPATLSNPGSPAFNASALPPGARLSVQVGAGFSPYTPPTAAASSPTPTTWSGLLPPSSPLVNPAVASPTGTPSNPGLIQSPPAY